jgi:hypothetical protein
LILKFLVSKRVAPVNVEINGMIRESIRVLTVSWNCVLKARPIANTTKSLPPTNALMSLPILLSIVSA